MKNRLASSFIVSCYYLVGIQGGKFTTPKGTGVICPPAAQVKELGTILSKAG